MPISGYFDVVFGSSGTLTSVPDAVQSDGSVSYTSGWGVDYTLPASNPSYKSVPQGSMNQLFYDITSAIQNWQQNTVAPFITTAMNGGTPYSYPAYAMVLYSGVVYISNTGSNTDTPPTSKWTALPLSFVENLFTGGTTTGSANAQVLASLSPASGFSLSNPGDTITCTAGYTNTGPATLAITSPSVSATAIQKNGASGLTALTGGEIVAGNIITFTVSAAGTLVLDAGLPATLFLQKSNNLSDVPSPSTALANLGGISNFTMTALAVDSIINATHASTGVVAGTGYAASSLTPVTTNSAGGQSGTGDSITGTWQALTSGTNSSQTVPFQRTA